LHLVCTHSQGHWILTACVCSDEYIHKYIDTRNKLEERQGEVMRNIVDHARQEEEVKFKLQEAMQTERQFMT